MRKLLCCGVWILLLAPKPLAAQSPQPPSAADKAVSLADVRRADREKISRAEKQLEKEARRDAIIDAIIDALTRDVTPEGRDEKALEDNVEAFLHLLGLNSKKQLEREINEQAEARRTGEIIVDHAKKDLARRTAEFIVEQRKLSNLLQPVPAKQLGNDDTGESMNPSQPASTKRVVFDDDAPKPSASPNVNMNPYQPAPITRTRNNPSRVNVKPAPPAPSKPFQPAPTKSNAVDPNTFKARYIPDVSMNSSSVNTKRVVFDDNATKQLAPKGVLMRIAIDRGTMQRAEAAPSLLQQIRKEK